MRQFRKRRGRRARAGAVARAFFDEIRFAAEPGRVLCITASIAPAIHLRACAGDVRMTISNRGRQHRTGSAGQAVQPATVRVQRGSRLRAGFRFAAMPSGLQADVGQFLARAGSNEAPRPPQRHRWKSSTRSESPADGHGTGASLNASEALLLSQRRSCCSLARFQVDVLRITACRACRACRWLAGDHHELRLNH